MSASASLDFKGYTNYIIIIIIYQISVSSSRPHILTSCRIRELVFILHKKLHSNVPDYYYYYYTEYSFLL